MKRGLFLLFAATLSACNLNVDNPQPSPTDPATETFAPSLGVNISTMTKTPSGAYFKDLALGTGSTMTGQPYITFTYIGFVKDGSTFGSNQQTTPYAVQNLPSGLQEGMQGMQIGGQRLVVVPSALGYGPNIVGAIPANSTLIFKIQLDGIF